MCPRDHVYGDFFYPLMSAMTHAAVILTQSGTQYDIDNLY